MVGLGDAEAAALAARPRAWGDVPQRANIDILRSNTAFHSTLAVLSARNAISTPELP